LATARQSVLCVGECLIDLLSSGERAGGAPANVAFHLAQSRSVDVALCSRTGSDSRGDKLREQLGRAGVDVGLWQTDKAEQTGVVRVKNGARGPVYDICEPAAWDHIAPASCALEAARGAAVVVCGTLAQRHPVSRSTVRVLVAEARRAGALVLADLNLRDPFFDGEIVLWTLRNCDVLKLSLAELRVVAAMLGARGSDESLLEGLAREFEVPRIVLTCGAEGARVLESDGMWSQSAVATGVRDTVGAGDAMTAVLAAALALGVSWRDAMPFASEVAAFVVAHEGAMPFWSGELVDRARTVLQGRA